MKQLFLTSEVNLVAESIEKKVKTKSGKLKTAYVTTPIEKGHEHDDLNWHKQNKKSMNDAGFDIFEYTITNKNLDQIQSDLANIDILYVEGGSLVHMLNQSRATGFDIFLKKFVEDGNPYIGTSTGSFIVATDTEAGLSLENYLEDNFNSKGIGLVNFLIMPHWGSEEFRQQYVDMPKNAYHTTTPLVVLNDNQYVWVTDNKTEIVSI